jgi:hypothetical protein
MLAVRRAASVVLVLGYAVLGGALGAAAQPAPPESEAAARAEKAFLARDWPTADSAYAALARSSPESGLFRFRQGVALVHLGRAAEALPLLDKAEALGWPALQVAFRKACAQARLGQKDAAFLELDRAARSGFAFVPLLQSEEDLAPLHAEGARWKAAVEAADRNAHPCLYDVRYRQLDFWVGVWDVRPNGAESQTPASNVITKEHDGCVVHEHWTAPASNGESFNVYDISRDRWYQTWVDNSGGLHEYKGGLEGANMVYFADLAPPRGQTARVPTRLTFFNQGENRVRQLSEATADGGKTWTVNYDFIYTRREPATH